MNMSKTMGKAALLLNMLWAGAARAEAVDSYHYLHVTINTPWTIFLVLVPMVLAPLILMGVLVWRYTERKKEDEAEEGKQE
jgi:hypothetical protein